VEQDQLEAIGRWAAGQLGADAVQMSNPAKMSGGAIQENWSIDAEITGGPHAGPLALVLRTDAPSGVSVSHPRAHEYALLKAAFAAGATVPEPIALDPDGAVIGKPFYLMRRAAGTANPRTLARNASLDPHRPSLTEGIGRELARIHSITPANKPALGSTTCADLEFLVGAGQDPIERRIREFKEQLDALPEPHPILELGIRWLERRRPSPSHGGLVLGHGDFRCGNIMVDTGEDAPDGTARVSAVLDWEFSSWTDPLEDVGWLCARCWRFGADERGVGGIGDRADFERGYEAVAGRALDWANVAYWEVLATIRWAIIALHQGERHLSGREFSMELALTGRKAAEMEYDVLLLTKYIDEHGILAGGAG
jgi:aminoglycoside phosphotransferase (APT) family kinase protein